MSQLPDITQLAKSISQCLPELQDVEPLEFVGEGFRSVAVETTDGVLIRVGKLEEAATGFELEIKVLPLVKRFVTAPIPEPQWHIRPCDEFPFAALGYMKLPGATPVPNDQSLAEFFMPELAAFLVSLHSIPAAEAQKLGVPLVNPLQRLAGAEPVVMPVLANRFSRVDYERLERWWTELHADQESEAYQPTVGHHDLWHENLLVGSDGHLSGVLDWSHIEVGDPMSDFAAIHHFGEGLAAQFIDEYRAAGGTMTDLQQSRIKRYWEGRHLGGLAWAIENSDVVEIEDGIRKLLVGPLLG